MSDISFEYEFDPYGENSNNLILKEAHTITAANGADFNFIVPRYAPFFRRSFVCRNMATGIPLRPSIDYFFGFRFDQVIVSGSSLPVYGAVVFADPAFTANVQIDYQTLGGEFVQSAATVLQLMANKVNDPRTLQWSAVVNLPTEFPPIPHRHDVNDLTTFSDVISAIYDLSDAQKAGFNKAMQALMEHINDHNNPHVVTLEQLGLDAIGNLVPATQDDAEQGTDNARYMTALRVNQAMTALFLPILQQHENDNTNPHKTTKDQVGLGLVENYRPANALEASAGVATNLYLTPQGGTLLAQTIVPVIMASHTGNFNNPHQTTAAQVGLGNVPNFAMATDAAAISGVSKTALMSPYLVSLMLQNGNGQTIAAHILDHNNPHDTTADQVGLGLVDNFRTATQPQAEAGTDNASFMTPLRTAQLVNKFISTNITGAINQHIQDTNNPHQTTASQVGLGKVANNPMAVVADLLSLSNPNAMVSPADLGYVLTNTILPQVQAQLKTLGNVSPIFSSSADLFDTFSNRYPYEYSFIDAVYSDAAWVGDANGCHPRFGSGVFTGAYQEVTSSNFPVAGFTGNVDLGAATRLSWVIGAYTGPNGPCYITLDAVGTTLNLNTHDIITPASSAVLSSFTALTLPSVIGTNAAWQVLPVWTNGAMTGVTGSINGRTFSVNMATTAAESVVGGATITPAMGFGVVSSATDTRFRVTNWFDNLLYYRDMTTSNTCYMFTDNAWTSVPVRDVAAAVVEGAWYFNRFNGETWGAVTDIDVVPLGTKKVVSSDEIVVTDTPGGYQLSLSGSVKRNLDLGNNDITFQM